jgi:hypothetical protein
VKKTALEIKELLEEISPLIEGYTAEVCPGCEDVCCKQRHAWYDEEDRVFIHALDCSEPEYSSRTADEPCEFLNSNGCIRPRWQRPFRCTWYFCVPLLEHMSERSGKKYRKMVKLLRRIIDLRNRLNGKEWLTSD